MTGPIAKDGILDMPAYVGGKEAVDGIADPFKLSANENPLGASPQALAALKNLGIPMAARALYARNWPRSMGWMQRALFAAMVRMIF